jgi:hypothetical protein
MNEPLIDEMISAVPDEKDEEDISGKGNDPAVQDHALDEMRYAGLALPKPREADEPNPAESWVKFFNRRGVSGVNGWSVGDG